MRKRREQIGVADRWYAGDAADRAQSDHIRLVVRQNDPVSLPPPHQRVGSLTLHAYNSLRPTARTPHRSR